MRISVLISCLVVAFLPGPVGAQSEVNVRARFASEMANVLLGGDATFISLGNGKGERGFLLAQPGSTIAPIIEAYSGVQGEFTQSLVAALVYDRPVNSSSGIAVFGGENLADVWREVLDSSRPGFIVSKDRALDVRTMRWLFRPGRITKKGRIYTRERSAFYDRYKEFEAKYVLLLSARQGDVWRAIPAFKKFKSYESAERSLIHEWFSSGYKSEIESAMWRFSAAVPFVEWDEWARANAKFESNMVPYADYVRLPVTRLFPPPASWSSVSMWYRGKSKGSEPDDEYRFQYARVKISRPWMDLDALLTGKLKPHQSEGSTSLVSDGASAVSGSFPGGRLNAFIEELVLVRQITRIGGQSGLPGLHPLGNFAYPDAINLIGFVVRVLPAPSPTAAKPVDNQISDVTSPNKN